MLPGWIAIVAALPSAWLGGELVERLGVGVADFQNLNAPSSLREAKRRPTAKTTVIAAASNQLATLLRKKGNARNARDARVPEP